jgi:hypothetical protein
MKKNDLVELLQMTDVDHDSVLAALRHFSETGEFDDEIVGDAATLKHIAKDVRHVLLLTIERPSLSGDETDTVGIFADKAGLPLILYSTSNATDIWDFSFLHSEADLGTEILSLLMDRLGWMLPQISGTTLTNSRPDLLPREWVERFRGLCSDHPKPAPQTSTENGKLCRP